MDALTHQPPSPAPPPPPRRVLLLGAGPLPEPGSRAAPGVANRLWNFLAPAIDAGHDCLALTLESGGWDGRGALPRPEERQRNGRRWWRLALGIEVFREPALLGGLIESFEPHVVAAAGTLQAASTACYLAGDCPVWVDLFGDPLAEIQAKAGQVGEGPVREDHLLVWRLMVQALLRADRFSTVSRRQRDALLGQLLLLGMTDGQVADAAAEEGEAGTLRALIESIPCSVERLDPPSAPPGVGERDAWLRAHGLPAGAEVALWSGGFNAWADPETLIGGLELAMAHRPALHFVATGGELPGYLGEVYWRAQALADKSPYADRMHLLGWLPLEDAQEWLRMADVGLVIDRPCAETRLGARNRLLSFAEALRPVVATRGTEVVEEMERAGALAACDSCNPAALSEALQEVLRDPGEAAAMARRSLDHCRAHYLFATTAAPFLAFLAQPGEAPEDDAAATGTQPAEPTATEWIADLLDLPRREQEWSELTRYRAGRLSRFGRWLKGE